MVKTESEINYSRELRWNAPIEIEDDSQFEIAGMQEYPVRTWRVGQKQVKVVLVPSDEETYKYMIRELRAKYLEDHRLMRCQVPGKGGRLIRCPETNKCARCPWGVSPADRQSWLISLSAFCGDEEGEGACELPFASDSDTAGEAETAIFLEMLKVHLANVDRSLVPVLELKLAGYRVEEICRKLSIPQSTVYKRLGQIRKGAKEILTA